MINHIFLVLFLIIYCSRITLFSSRRMNRQIFIIYLELQAFSLTANYC